ncbi:hypothetical protein GOHSU_40_00320 [Gordonia hirsuta DSM 44140 = NBRC 16056]|uniref:Uncharacterized protein n=1 Tax=Gordonia hirsuta DSM 44140 = NBRC 16056 TaxID=1121927 RepID=L7LEG7_9ACTN|nr:hypothetical protein [Gordonia hirsuta]GAC58448.1 hypothetical protein GOHSU_40_00320 [Gordonia hirsuta DSM 44140 = NBRC 16056]
MTNQNSWNTQSSGTSFWKILAVVIGALILLSIASALVKAALWLLVAALVVIGAFTVIKAFSSD